MSNGYNENSVTYENTRLADYTNDSSISRGGVDIPFALITVLLLGIGVVMVLSASFARAYYDLENETKGVATYYFIRQSIFALGGVGIMFVCSRFPISFYRRFSFLVTLPWADVKLVITPFSTTSVSAT